MPVATVTNDTEVIELKSCPGGVVTLRRMSYGEKLMRQNLVSKMQIATNSKSKDVKGEIDMLNSKVNIFDFQHAVVDHNLTNGMEQKLDFKKQTDIESLTAQIGEEISNAIDKMNNFEEDEETGNSSGG